MNKNVFDMRNILSIAVVYTFWQKLIGDFKLRKIYCKEFVKAKTGDKILDIGCGPANMVEYLPQNINYVGFDQSENYIKNAKKKYATSNYEFFCSTVNFAENFDEKFDIIMANAILHHINDDEADKLIKFASQNLKSGGRLITHDGCFINNQSKAAIWLLQNDRGKFVRSKEEYFTLFSKYFNNIKVTIRHDLYNIPYTTVIFEATLKS